MFIHTHSLYLVFDMHLYLVSKLHQIFIYLIHTIHHLPSKNPGMFDSKAGLGQNPAHLTAQVKVAEFPEFNLEVPTALCNIYFFYVAWLSDGHAQSKKNNQ